LEEKIREITLKEKNPSGKREREIKEKEKERERERAREREKEVTREKRRSARGQQEVNFKRQSPMRRVPRAGGERREERRGHLMIDVRLCGALAARS